MTKDITLSRILRTCTPPIHSRHTKAKDPEELKLLLDARVVSAYCFRTCTYLDGCRFKRGIILEAPSTQNQRKIVMDLAFAKLDNIGIGTKWKAVANIVKVVQRT